MMNSNLQNQEHLKLILYVKYTNKTKQNKMGGGVKPHQTIKLDNTPYKFFWLVLS